MKTGTVISVSAHAVLIVFAIFGLPDRERDMEPMTAQVSDVSIVSLEAFEAARSSAPDPMNVDEPQMSAPADDTSTPDAPDADTKPIVPEADLPDAPTTETAPDASGLAQVRPNISTDVAIPEASIDQGQVGLETPLIDAAPQDGSVNSTQTAMLEPPRPNLAPRIDTSAAPKPPEPVKEAPEVVEETTNENAEAAPPKEEQEAAAPKESATETVPDAKPEERPTTPVAATRPKGRPANLQAEAEKKRKAEEAAIAAALAAATATQTAEAAPEPDTTEPGPQGSRLGQDFNSSQRQAVGDAVGEFWNKTLIEGKDGYETLVVTVRVKLTAAGRIIGGVQPVDPARPKGDFNVAYEAARRAVMRAQPIPLPQDVFRDGDFLEIRFDPGRGAISLN